MYKVYRCAFRGLETDEDGRYDVDGDEVCVGCLLWIEQVEEAEDDVVDYPEDWRL